MCHPAFTIKLGGWLSALHAELRFPLQVSANATEEDCFLAAAVGAERDMIFVLGLISLGFAGFGIFGIYEAFGASGAIIPIVKTCVFFALALVAALAARETYLGRRPVATNRQEQKIAR